MQVRPIRETDIEAVIQLFRANYGDDYAIPEFYDPQWVKRGVYADHIIWLVLEDEGRIVASAACILDFGDYNDQIGEIGRVVVDPSVSGKGLGRTLLTALVDASDERVEFAFGEARTTHPKTQKIFDRLGLVPIGFLPMAYQMSWRESFVLNGQLFGNGRTLRLPGAAQVIAEVAPLAALSLANLGLDDRPQVVEARAYPVEHSLEITPLTGKSLVRLLKIEQGRLLDPEVFGGLHLDQGYSHLQARKATYLVAQADGQTVGAVGYMDDAASKNVRIVELIARDDAVKGSLLRRAVEAAELEHGAEVIDCDVSAHSPRLQRTLLEMGFLPVAYVPGMVFHQTARYDVTRFMKLTVPLDLGHVEFTEPSQAYVDIVMPAFQAADARYASTRALAQSASVLAGLSPLDVHFVQSASVTRTLTAGTPLAPDGLYIVLAGTLTHAQATLTRGASWGAASLLGQTPTSPPVTVEETRVLHLTPAAFAQLAERYPRLGVRLYRNLTAPA